MLVGERMYIVVNTRPEISHEVNRYTCSKLGDMIWCFPSSQFYEGIKNIIKERYLAGVEQLRLTLEVLKKVFFFFRFTHLLMTNSRKSTWCDVNVRSAFAGAKEVQFSRKLAAELGFWQAAPNSLFKDNTGVYRSCRARQLRRSKHIHWLFIFNYIRGGIIKPRQVPTSQQVAEIATKARFCLGLPFSVLLMRI